MEKILLFLILQLFQLSLNQPAKELPIYSQINSQNNEII